MSKETLTSIESMPIREGTWKTMSTTSGKCFRRIKMFTSKRIPES